LGNRSITDQIKVDYISEVIW